MQIFRNRPLALAACVMALTAILAMRGTGAGKLFLLGWLLLFALILTAWSFRSRRCGARRAVWILCLFTASIALLSSWLFFNGRVEKLSRRAGEICTVEGRVEERLGAMPQESRFLVRITELGGECVRETMLLECSYLSALQAGDAFRLTAEIGDVYSSGEPETDRASEADRAREVQYLLANGCAGVLRCGDYRDCSVYPEVGKDWRVRLTGINARLCGNLQRAIGGEEGKLAAALLLGNRSGLSGDTVLNFRRAGISHLLALSGLHVSVLVGILEFLLRRLRVPRVIRAVSIPLLALGYLLLTGGAVSTVRAVLMICVLYLGFLFQESYDPLTALCTVLMLILTVTPYAVADVSLWMSFAASAAILVFVPAVRVCFERAGWAGRLPRALVRVMRGAAELLAVGVFANAAVLVLSAVFFGSSSVFSVPVTILLSPILTPGLFLSAIVLLIPHCTPVVWLARECMKLLLAVASRISEIPDAIVLLSGTGARILLILLSAVLALLAVLKLRKRRWLLLPVALSAAVLLAGYADILPREQGTAVTYIRSGKNEALLFSEGHRAVAVDLSDGSATLGNALVDAMESAKCTELQELLFTHYHSKMPYLIASLSDSVKIRAIRFPEPMSEKERAIAARLEQEALLHGIPVSYGGDCVEVGNIELLEWNRLDSPNVEVPVLLMLRVNGRILTYLGSGIMGSALEERALNAVRSAEVLIVGGHGTVPKSPRMLPIPDGASRVIYATRELSELYPPAESPPEVVAEVESDRFFLK